MSWVRPRARPRIHKAPFGPKKGLPIGIGPHITRPDQTEADHLGFRDFDKVFNNYDDSTIKPGMPFTGMFGSANLPQCAYCKKDMRINDNRQILYCPYCRRELAIDIGRHTYNYEDERETKGDEVAINSPTELDMKFDHQQYQTKVPGDLW